MVLVSANMAGDGRNSAFRKLFGYISGDNEGAVSIAMTAPVIMDNNSKGEKIAMTAPVFHVAKSESAHTISFVLPSDTSAAPSPARSELTTHQIPAITVAAVKFSGGWREDRVKRFEAELHRSLASMNVRETGDVMFARYDPPWKPGILRRNEVLIPVNPSTIPEL
jgi:hypothetical protein